MSMVCTPGAPGSSDSLASATPWGVYAIPRSEVSLVFPALHVRSRFPLRAAAACQSLPHVNGPTVSEYYGLIRLPRVFGSPTSFGSAYLLPVGDMTHIPAQEPLGPPKSLLLLSTHTMLFVDPGRPSGILPPTRIPLCGLPVR